MPSASRSRIAKAMRANARKLKAAARTMRSASRSRIAKAMRANARKPKPAARTISSANISTNAKATRANAMDMMIDAYWEKTDSVSISCVLKAPHHQTNNQAYNLQGRRCVSFWHT